MGSKGACLLSGGIDSAVTAAIARARGHDLYALSVTYHQRHHPFRLFLRFLESMKGLGTAEAGSLCEAVLRTEVASSNRRALQGIAMVLGGLVVAGAAIALSRWPDPWVRFLHMPVLLGGLLILTPWGLARLVRAVASLVRVRGLASTCKRASTLP
jgi:hypothetical protein